VRHAASYTIDDTKIQIDAVITRALRKVTEADPLSTRVLEEYLGPTPWSEKNGGRIMAIWKLTKPGAQLIEHARHLASSGSSVAEMSDDEVLADEIRHQKQKPNDLRAHLIRAAMDNADTLLKRAREALVLADSGMGWTLRSRAAG
jgi:hypothetical protein